MSLSVTIHLTFLVTNVKSRAIFAGVTRESSLRSTEMGLGVERNPTVQGLVHEPIGMVFFIV